jgi:hypothetical protein
VQLEEEREVIGGGRPEIDTVHGLRPPHAGRRRHGDPVARFDTIGSRHESTVAAGAERI